MDRKAFFSKAFQLCVGKGLELLTENPLIEGLEQLATDATDAAAPAQPKGLWERPPGADADDKRFLELCTGCDACMIACPVNVIMVHDLERRDPVIFPATAPCIHCQGYPCIAACPTSALKHWT